MIDSRLDQARAKLQLRLTSARRQLKTLPPQSPSSGHLQGVVAGLEEALTLVRSV